MDALEDEVAESAALGQRLQDSAKADRAAVLQVVRDVSTQLPALRADVSRPWIDLAAFGRLPRGSQLLLAAALLLGVLGWLLHLGR